MTNSTLEVPSPVQLRDFSPAATSGVAVRLASAIFLLFIYAVEFALALRPGLYTDENQFITSGVLLARKGLLPYRDYAYFHTPNLVFVYGFLFRSFDHLVVVARSVSATSACVTLTILFAFTWKLFSDRRPWARFGASACVVSLIVANCVFTYTTGKAWNHDAPLLLTLIAFFAVLRGISGRSHLGLLAIAGVLLGLAMGCRITFAAATFALAAGVLALSRESWCRRIAGAGVLLLAATLAMTPTFITFALAPREFLFGNFQFRQLAAIYAESVDKAALTTGHLIGSKIATIFKHTVGGGPTLILLAVGVVAHYRAKIDVATMPVLRLKVRLLELVTFYLWLAAAVSTPGYSQYYYDMLPFLAMLVVCHVWLACHNRQIPWKLAATLLVGTLAFNPTIFYRIFFQTHSLDTLQAVRMHQYGNKVASTIGRHGSVLTLDPVLALEGHLDIYKPYASGKFALRVAPLTDGPSLHQMGFAASGMPLDLSDPPVAFISCEDGKGLQEIFQKYAETRHWRRYAGPTDDYEIWCQER